MQSVDGLLSFPMFFPERVVVKTKKFEAKITGYDGEVIFHLPEVEAPEDWSQQAVNIVASKYFYRGEGKKETSVLQLINRVVGAITKAGIEEGYFDRAEAHVFSVQLKYILLTQRASFNSPVWFNVGVHDHPQSSACFINGVEDNMESITDLAKTEMLLFKYGSGTGTNFSSLRSSKEWSTKGGFKSSGPVSFMKGYDAFAGIIKSGGKTRRAAKMVILNVDHPDIEEFIACKTREEKKAHALIKAGFDADFTKSEGAYGSVGYQNANHSVRVTKEFMKAVKEDDEYHLRGIMDKSKIFETLKARKVWQQIAESAWACGDPGVQYDDNINEMHTCPNTGRINASNPCSEYMFLDNSACNLASINLLKFFTPRIDAHHDVKNHFLVDDFKHTVEILITAMDILVSLSSYPTPAISKNSEDYRPLGLGYANLGAAFMTNGLAYDSYEAASLTNYLTSLMTGYAYQASGFIANVKGPFNGFSRNRTPFIDVIRKHAEGSAFKLLNTSGGFEKIYRPMDNLEAGVWANVLAMVQNKGLRNSQISVIAPTGTIAFMMDCDTTGIEPDLALVKTKKLVGGGSMKIVNQAVPRALKALGVSDEGAHLLVQELLKKNGNMESALEEFSGLKPLVPLAIFDCALAPQGSKRSISWQAHLNIMAAAQPFISGAISKTVNIPEETSVEMIAEIYEKAYDLKLKAVALYRDNCKASQPMSTAGEKAPITAELSDELLKVISGRAIRRRMPDDRQAYTHKFNVGGHKGYLTVGLFEDGTPGELFITISKEGSTISGFLDTVATLTSIALQHGIPLETLVRKFRGQKFEPNGFTANPDIRTTTSITDYIFRWLGLKFGVEKAPPSPIQAAIPQGVPKPVALIEEPKESGPPCLNCGAITQRNGSCHVCPDCGNTTGCS